jgi:2'-5' RNA ligase
MTIRFIIITVPPASVAKAIDRIRRPLCHTYGAPAALTYPPHVTLRTGVRVPERKVPHFIDEFSRLLQGMPPVMLQTAGLHFGRYQVRGEIKYIVAYRIVPSALLLALHHRLLSYGRYQKGPQSPYHPHLTLAFDDLSELAWRQLRGILTARGAALPAFQWCCDNVCLFRYRRGRWIPHKVLGLGAVREISPRLRQSVKRGCYHRRNPIRIPHR